MSAPVDPVGGAAAQQVARAELHLPQYKQPPPGLLTRVLHWFGRRIGDLLSGGAGGNALVIVLVLLLGGVVVLAVRAGSPRRAARSALATADPLAPDARVDHRVRALEHAAAGRPAEALREWLRDAVATIEARGVLPPRPGRTGRAVAREAGPLLPAAAAPLAAATAAFDEIWFGGRTAGEPDVALGHAAADEVRAARVAVHAAQVSPDGIAVPW